MNFKLITGEFEVVKINCLKNIIFVTAIAIVSLCGQLTLASVYYADLINGRDSNTGSDLAPFQNYLIAWQAASANGDTIMLYPGSYINTSAGFRAGQSLTVASVSPYSPASLGNSAQSTFTLGATANPFVELNLSNINYYATGNVLIGSGSNTAGVYVAGGSFNILNANAFYVPSGSYSYGIMQADAASQISICATNIQVVNNAASVGLVDFSAVTGGVLRTVGPFYVGRSDTIGTGNKYASGTLLLGPDWDVQIGPAAANARVSTVSIGHNYSTGLLSIAKGGHFSVFADNMYVGYGQPLGRGILEASELESCSLDVNSLRVGGAGDPAKAYGHINFSGVHNGTLKINTLLNVAMDAKDDAGSYGLVQFGTNWNITVGSPQAFATQLNFAYRGNTGIWYVAEGGNLSVHATQMALGRNGARAIVSMPRLDSANLVVTNLQMMGSGTDGNTGYVEVDFSEVNNGTLAIKNALQMAQSAKANDGQTSAGYDTVSAVLKLGSGWDVSIGEPNAFATEVTCGSNRTTGHVFTAAGGNFSAYITKFECSRASNILFDFADYDSAHVEITNLTLGYGRQTLDFSNVKDFSGDIKTASIGESTPNQSYMQAFPKLSLGRGTCTIGSLLIGSTTARAANNGPRVELHGTQVSGITNLNIRQGGVVSNFVNGASSGFVFPDEFPSPVDSTPIKFVPTIASTTTHAFSGGINVLFDALPEGARCVNGPESADFIYWGIAWEGVGSGIKEAEIETLIANQKIAIFKNLGSPYNEKLGYIYDANGNFSNSIPTTYYGFYMRHIQPATVIIIK